jgi:hypothetical protein
MTAVKLLAASSTTDFRVAHSLMNIAEAGFVVIKCVMHTQNY